MAPALTSDSLRRCTAVAAALALFAASPSYAGGPTYSRFGVGDLSLSLNGQSFAMGLASLAVPGDGGILLNPATLHAVTRVRLTAGFEFSHYSSQDAGATSSYSRGDFQGLAVAIPVDVAHGAVLAAGAAPYSRVLYAVERSDSVNGVHYSQVFRGSGGLSTLVLGGSYRITPTFVAGASVNYLYGRIRQINQVDFSDVLFSDSNFDRSWFHSGFFVSGGIVLKGVGTTLGIPALAALDVGIVYSTPANLDVREERLITSSLGSDTSLVRRGDTRVPQRLGFGLAYPLGERTVVAGDFLLQDWGSATVFSQPEGQALKNSFRVGIGVEIQPARDRTAYGDRLYYRFGAAYHASYVKIGDESIDEILATGGIGLPLGPLAYLNVGMQAGVRGSVAGALQRDTFLRLSLSVSGGEEWFMDLIEE